MTVINVNFLWSNEGARPLLPVKIMTMPNSLFKDNCSSMEEFVDIVGDLIQG